MMIFNCIVKIRKVLSPHFIWPTNIRVICTLVITTIIRMKKIITMHKDIPIGGKTECDAVGDDKTIIINNAS